MAPLWPERAGALIAALSFVVFVHGCAEGLQGPVLFHPLPPAVEGYDLTRGALRFRNEDLSVTVRPVDRRLVGKRYDSDGLTLPYGEDPNVMSAFVFFSLRFENHSSQTLLFNPIRASAFTQGSELLVPIDVTDLYLFGPRTSDLEERTRAFLATSYDGSTTVTPGGALERYLVFPAPRDEVKTLRVVLDDVYVGSRGYTLRFSFEAFPAEKTQ